MRKRLKRALMLVLVLALTAGLWPVTAEAAGSQYVSLDYYNNRITVDA